MSTLFAFKDHAHTLSPLTYSNFHQNHSIHSHFPSRHIRTFHLCTHTRKGENIFKINISDHHQEQCNWFKFAYVHTLHQSPSLSLPRSLTMPFALVIEILFAQILKYWLTFDWTITTRGCEKLVIPRASSGMCMTWYSETRWIDLVLILDQRNGLPYSWFPRWPFRFCLNLIIVGISLICSGTSL